MVFGERLDDAAHLVHVSLLGIHQCIGRFLPLQDVGIFDFVQGTYMTTSSNDLILRTKIFLDFGNLRGGFDNHQKCLGILHVYANIHEVKPIS